MGFLRGFALSHEVLPFILSVLSALLWAWLVAWLFGRRLGVPIPQNPFKRPRPRLRMNVEQHIFLGITAFGVSLLIFDSMDQWLRWKLYRVGPPDWYDFGREIISPLLAGAIYGLVSALSESREKQP